VVGVLESTADGVTAAGTANRRIREFERFVRQHIGVTMETPMKDLDTWTTDELLTEVLYRSAGDRPALDRIQVTTMRALLNDCDLKADAGTQPATGQAGLLSIGQHNESL
jgi:hypothetical protein